VRSAHACFNSMLDISCGEESSSTGGGAGAMLAFDSARYGRNDSLVAARCDVPFSSNCDVDVQFLLNRACAGRRRCSIDVGVARFTDPCGYAEFLVVSYRCVPGQPTTGAARSCLDELLIISARCNMYISRLCYDVSVRLSVRLSVCL